MFKTSLAEVLMNSRSGVPVKLLSAHSASKFSLCLLLCKATFEFFDSRYLAKIDIFDSLSQVGKMISDLFPVRWLAMLNNCFESFPDYIILDEK